MGTRIVLIRHAPTDTAGRLCGTLDLPLTAAGRAQLIETIDRRPISKVPAALYTSPLTRAREVADALGRAWNLDPRLAPWAREIECGAMEGMPLARLQQQHPDLWARNEAQDDETFAWPGGESYGAFRARVLGGLTAIACDHSGQRVAVVTHAGVITQVLGVVRRRPASVWSADRPDPLTATEVAWNGDGPTAVLRWNQRDWY